MTHELEKRTAFLTEEKINRVHPRLPGIPTNFLANDPAVKALCEEIFPECNLVTEDFYENRNVHNEQGKIRAYLGNIGKIDRDVKIIRKALKRQRDDRIVKITAQPKYPLSYVFSFHDPWKDGYYEKWQDIEVHVKRRHYDTIKKKGNPWWIYFGCLELALSEHLNRRGNAKYNRGGGYNVGLRIEDWKYGHFVEVLPLTSKFVKNVENTSWCKPEKVKFEESSFVARVPEVYVGEFKEAEEYYHPLLGK